MFVRQLNWKNLFWKINIELCVLTTLKNTDNTITACIF